jgi:RinA family phage transcriptional activator
MEFDAVRAAVKKTLLKEDGKERMRLIRRVYWSRDKRTISGIAIDMFISRATAFRWMADFIMTVAECFGIYDPE